MHIIIYIIRIGILFTTLSLLISFNSCASTSNNIDIKYNKMTPVSWLQETNTLSVFEEYTFKISGSISGDFIFTIFANTQCEHCKTEVAKILKILEIYSIDESHVQIYNLNDDFEEITGTYKDYNIYSIPSLFIKKNGILIGKSEGPIYTWEEDIIKYCND